MVCSREFDRIVSRSWPRGRDPGEAASRRVESRAKLGAVVAGYGYVVRWRVRISCAHYEGELRAYGDGLRTWDHERGWTVSLHLDGRVRAGEEETVRGFELH